MKIPDKGYFFKINGLVVPRGSDPRFIHNNINQYIDAIQGLAESFEQHFGEKKRDMAIQDMEAILSLLRGVYAQWLEMQGDVILRNLKNGSAEQTRALVRPFLADLLSLSIEMQKAQSSDENKKSKTEEHANMANNLSAVGMMIDGGEYEKARGMVANLKEGNSGAVLIDLLDLLSEKKYDEAGKLAVVLKEKHRDALKGAAPESSPKTVLAVDDRPEILTNISHILKGHYKVFGVTSGPAALRLLETRAPDLFILDIDMPGMNGFELALAIRANARHARAPIIFLTGNSSRDHVLGALQAGGNDFIVKPARSDTLLAKVGKYLQLN